MLVCFLSIGYFLRPVTLIVGVDLRVIVTVVKCQGWPLAAT